MNASFADFLWALQDACLKYRSEMRAVVQGEGQWRTVVLTHPPQVWMPQHSWRLIGDAKVSGFDERTDARVSGELVLTNVADKGEVIARLPLDTLQGAFESDGREGLIQILAVTYNIAKADGKVGRHENAQDKASVRYAFGFTDPKGLYGSPSP